MKYKEKKIKLSTMDKKNITKYSNTCGDLHGSNCNHLRLENQNK